MRFLLTSWGSLGDLHPFLALGRGLLARGHRVSLVGHPDWSAPAQAAGLMFIPTDEPPRDDLLLLHPEVMSTRAGGLPGLRALVRHGIEPSLDPMLARLREAAESHDVIVAHHFVFSAHAAAELFGLPLVSVSLAPGVTPSAYSRPGPNSGHAASGPIARALNRLIWWGGHASTQLLIDPVINRFRARHGLSRRRGAVFGAGTARLHLELYSEHFAPAPPDWPAGRQPSGFCFFDPAVDIETARRLNEFLDRGEPPVLFTLGSAAVQVPGTFFENAVKALGQRGLRGILLGSKIEGFQILPESILALPYVPYGAVMPRACAVVHQCGIGTVAQSLRAGVPSVACPFAFDQPNNARRLQALGAAEVLLPAQRSASAMAQALDRLLSGNAPAKARAIGERIRGEDGVGAACERIERAFA